MQTALLLLLPAFLLAITLLSINRRSRRQGKWTPEQTHAPHIEWLSDERQTIHFIRNNTYRSATDFDVHYLTKTLNVADLESLFYIVEPFSPWPGTAHTFLSFRFKSGETYAISVEARRKVSGIIFTTPRIHASVSTHLCYRNRKGCGRASRQPTGNMSSADTR